MDQDAFRKTYHDVNQCSCVYEKSILTNQCDCSRAERFCIAEREGVRCLSEEGRKRCLTLLTALRNQARFALRTVPDRSILPHGKAMRVQVGGLRGLFSAVHAGRTMPHPIPDIYALVATAHTQYGDFAGLPFPLIMRHVAAYEGRRPSRRRNR